MDAGLSQPAASAAPDRTGPWVRWWWPGNALDEAELSSQLRDFAAAGFSGVEISPIYGVPGSEKRQVEFLSPRFTARVAHAIREAHRLGMQVDMILGTGWPFGGPRIPLEDAATKWSFHDWSAEAGTTITVPAALPGIPQSRLVGVVARTGAPGATPVVRLATAGGSSLALDLPGNDAGTVTGVYSAPTGQRVKRAGPGGEGWVLDHLDPEVCQRYFEHFDSFLKSLPAPGLRCVFNDSWEVYGADCSAHLLETFSRQTGVSLDALLPEMVDSSRNGYGSPLRFVYRKHVEATVRDEFLGGWRRWARTHHLAIRNQAHGSPGNLIDLYAAADIPECELFQGSVLRLIGEAPLAGTKAGEIDQAWEELVVCRMAASAAKISGKTLASAEAFTWLGDHGRVPLAHMRFQAALLFACGINHIVFHGSMASPPGLPWPGWTFYASTHTGPTTSWWPDLPVLNAWIARNQRKLRDGISDGDLLVWVPFDDALERSGENIVETFSVHHTARWLREAMPGFSAVHRALDASGHFYDCVSERLLASSVGVRDGRLCAEEARWNTLVVPRSKRVPAVLISEIDRLLRDGATVWFVDDLPSPACVLSLPHDNKVATAHRLLAGWTQSLRSSGGMRSARIGNGQLRVGSAAELVAASPACAMGTDGSGASVRLLGQRRRLGTETAVLIVNADTRTAEWVEIASSGAVRRGSPVVWDPETDRRHSVRVTTNSKGFSRLRLPLAPGESRWVLFGDASHHPPLLAPSPHGHHRMDGLWEISAVRGGPVLPPGLRSAELGDWCAHGGVWTEFSGTLRYRCRAGVPTTGHGWILDLGDVRHSARVFVDGEFIGSCIAPPYRIVLPANLPASFELAIDVTNLDANRLSAMDRRREPWKPFFLVDSDYKPFDASRWKPLPSGLLGPVLMLPATRPDRY